MRDIWFLKRAIEKIEALSNGDRELAELTLANWYLVRCDCSVEEVLQKTRQVIWRQRRELVAEQHSEVF